MLHGLYKHVGPRRRQPHGTDGLLLSAILQRDVVPGGAETGQRGVRAETGAAGTSASGPALYLPGGQRGLACPCPWPTVTLATREQSEKH